MAKLKDQIYADHILDAIGLVEQFIAGKPLGEFQANAMLHSAVTMQIEITGEAAKRL